MTLALLFALACTSDKEPGETGAPLTGPTLTHTPPVDALIEGGSVELEVLAEDEDGVASVTLRYRGEGERSWESLSLTDQGDGRWTGTVTALEEPALEYWFSASDDADVPVSTQLPQEGEDAPFSLDVLVDALDLPFEEDFEPDADEDSLYELGWWTPSQGFPGSPWQLGEGEEGYGAVHNRGVSEDQTIQDWLISPPLDLSTLDAAMVLWRETGANTDAASHGLYISTTGRDPDAGDFVAVSTPLALPPEGQWGSSEAYDLSDWAGEPVVYLAWLYEGAVADDWSIDDVSVRALAPDLEAALSWSPDPVRPGETATLTVTLTNDVDAGTSGLQATLSLPDGGGTLDDDTADVGDIAPLGTAEAEFSLTLDPALDDNQMLPLALEVTDGLDTWSFELEMVVGEPSTGALVISLDAAASVSVSLGVGDPDAPTVETSLYTGALSEGEHTLSADLTDYHDHLPPAAGETRWFARITAGEAGSVEDFTITVGGEDHAATELPDLVADTEAIVWLPEPPDPVLVEVETEPDPVAPGDNGVALSLELANDGEDTSGPVTGTFTSDDPDATLSGGEALVVDDDVWRAGETVTLSGLTLDVSADHLDSSPLSLTLTLDDGVESWTVPVEIEVPWPVLRVIAIEIDDEGGDGLLDAGESAELSLTVANTGALDTFSSLSAVLSVAEGSEVEATVLAGSDSIATIDAGSSRESDGYEIEVGDGETGDTLALTLTLSDRDASYTAEVEIPLGEAPWANVSAEEDPTGDAVGDYGFDFVRVRWRVVDGLLSFWLSSDVSYDPDTLFVEAWALSGGADYTYYRIVYQSGTGKLQGYNDGEGFSTIGDVEHEVLSETDLLLTLDTEDMGLLLNQLSIGFAAGWCGPDTYYCDHYPDDWGYPYVSFSTSEWFALSW